MKYKSVHCQFARIMGSPSTRREWIEIIFNLLSCGTLPSLPPHGGSGLKLDLIEHLEPYVGLPPHGGSGLKYSISEKILFEIETSPSTRREWIEIDIAKVVKGICGRLPPHGGSGLKFFYAGMKRMPKNKSPSTRREWIEITDSTQLDSDGMSPSTRREWIEMAHRAAGILFSPVSLHTEGVD